MEQLTDTRAHSRDDFLEVSGCKQDWYPAFRSVTDRVLAVILLVLFWPIFAAIAIAIKVESRGPVFFRQKRIGAGRREFWMYKFRTMCDGAEKMLDELQHLNEEPTGLIVKLKDDPRVTRLGRYLRSSSIDELPQLINVARGELALIGPRPPSPAEIARYDERQMLRLTAKPGLTGLWQISGRKNLTFEQMVELDIKYAQEQSMLLDLLILVKTLPAIFSRNGAR